MSAETPDPRIEAGAIGMQPDEAYWDSMEPEQQRQYLDIVAEVLAAADAVDPVRRQHAAALALCDSFAHDDGCMGGDCEANIITAGFRAALEETP